MQNKQNCEELWEAFKSGNKKAFAEIYQTYVRILLNYGSRISSDSSLVEDSIQDLFIELWKSRKNLSSTSSIKFYLIKALRFKIYRNKKTSHAAETAALEDCMPSLETMLQDDHEIEFEVRSQQMMHLKETLEKLPARQREAINLRYFHNFSNEEIAEIMHINYHSACKFIYAGLKNLKENLKVAVMSILAILSVIFFL